MTDPRHTPVLLAEVIEALAPADGHRYVDATFGAGGYTAAILDAAHCHVTAIDRDPDAIAEGAALASARTNRLTLVQGRFGEIETLVPQAVDGFAFDLGVSSMQLDRAERGFSFRFEGPLDMRMGRSGRSAADLVNTAEESELADIIYLYGEDRLSRRIAREIVRVRGQTPFETTKQLAAAIRRVVPSGKHEIDPATRTFQALRIVVNEEMDELNRGLAAAEKRLKPGGRLVVVTFHSLEDRVVKAFLKTRTGQASAPSRYQPAHAAEAAPSFRLIGRKHIDPSEAEIKTNPRARSARLRAAERTTAPSWGEAA